METSGWTLAGVLFAALLVWNGALLSGIKKNQSELWQELTELKDGVLQRISVVETKHANLARQLSQIWQKCFGGGKGLNDCDK